MLDKDFKEIVPQGKREPFLAWVLVCSMSIFVLSKIFKQGQFISIYLAPLKLIL